MLPGEYPLAERDGKGADKVVLGACTGSVAVAVEKAGGSEPGIENPDEAFWLAGAVAVSWLKSFGAVDASASAGPMPGGSVKPAFGSDDAVDDEVVDDGAVVLAEIE